MIICGGFLGKLNLQDTEELRNTIEIIRDIIQEKLDLLVLGI